MINSLNTEKQTWWIAHNNLDVVHHGSVVEGQSVLTGQPFLETFDNKVEWEKRLMSLLPPEEYIEYTETQEEEQQIYSGAKETMGIVDHLLYTDSIDHLLYENKGFRGVENLNNGVD